MQATIPSSRYSAAEEIANTITSAIGVVLAIVGSAVLLIAAVESGTAWHIGSCSVFAATLILLYAAATLYHGIQRPHAKYILRILDHSAIFLLIAGTYTPFVLVSLRGPWGWSLFGVIWGLALLGIVFGNQLRHKRVLSVGFYIVMGWIMLVAPKPMLAAVEPMGLILLLIGGLAYTLGVGFYAWHRLPYHHAIWHLFVLAGSIAHYFAILFYVVPTRR